jgi:hypothetical protein
VNHLIFLIRDSFPETIPYLLPNLPLVCQQKMEFYFWLDKVFELRYVITNYTFINKYF